ncbi:MAG: response regulator [Proteobacteria bacterium]|nr:response regulator [Pseudomonadota bacterium]
MTKSNTAISDQKKLCILVAEDNEINQKLIQRILQTAGYSVDMVDNGRQAVEFSSRIQYDLILMDIQMPLMDGYEAAKRIRNAECGMRNKIEKDTDAGDQRPETSGQRPVAIVALTGNDIEGEIEKCRSLGINDCIGKPLSRDQLLSLIKKWTATEPVGPAAGQAPKDVSLPVAKKTSAHQPINLDRALSEFMGEKEILYGLLKEFTAKVRSQIKAIQQAILSQDYKVVAQEAHSIKGGAANLTADKVAGIASDLEKAADLKQTEPVRHLVGMLEEKLQQLETYLQNTIVSVQGVGK